MDDKIYAYTPPGGDPARVLKLVNLLLLVVCAVLIILPVVRHATVSTDVPADTGISLNGHTLAASTTKKIHPGTYQLTVQSPLYVAVQPALHVGGSQHIVISDNNLKKRTPTEIFSSLVPGSGAYGTPEFADYRWFADNTWLAGAVGPGSPSYAALHYGSNHTWSVVYYSEAGYSQDYSQLPSDVSNYLQALQEHYEQND